MLPVDALEGAIGEQGVVEFPEAGVFPQRPDEVAEGQPVHIPQEVVLVLAFPEDGWLGCPHGCRVVDRLY